MTMLPDKDLFHVTEAVWLVADCIGRTHTAVERQIYRGIEDGSIRARIVLGRKMLDRDEVRRIIEGDPA
jgi:hypothetical protein